MSENIAILTKTFNDTTTYALFEFKGSRMPRYDVLPITDEFGKVHIETLLGEFYPNGKIVHNASKEQLTKFYNHFKTGLNNPQFKNRNASDNFEYFDQLEITPLSLKATLLSKEEQKPREPHRFYSSP